MPVADRLRRLAGCFTFLFILAADSRAADLPRYQLQVGQKLVYQQKWRITVGAGATEDLVATWKIYVIGQNANGSWRVVAAMTSGGKFHQGQREMNVEPLAAAGIYDLSADGRVQLIQGDEAVVDLAAIFPRLPENPAELSSGWEDQTPDHSRIVQYKSAPATQPDEAFSLSGTPVGGFDAIRRRGIVNVYHMDIHRRLIVAAEQSTKEGESDRPSSGTLQLISLEQADPAIVTAISKASEAYIHVVEKYKAALAGGQNNPSIKDAQTALAQSANQLTAAAWNDGVALKSVPGINSMTPDPPPPNPALAKSALAQAGASYGIVGAIVAGMSAITTPSAPPPVQPISPQPAADWTSAGYDGQAHSLKDFRGKVVVLDFWFRDCPWCIREMPQLVQLFADFKDQPVQIIGMNTDTDPRDAQFVIDAMRLPYLNVKAADIQAKYPLEGAPTVMIIDKNGVIRDRLVGYDALRYDEMKAKVNEFLK